MKIEVSNLGPRVTDDSLGATFSAHGRVSQAQVRTRDNTGRTGFIEMPNAQEAATAILKIHGAVIDGHTIDVRPGE